MSSSTLMKAAPALSILLTRNPYHHNVPLLSPSLSFSLFPIQIAGTVTMTGTNIKTRCKNLKPVATGSIIQMSKNNHMPLLHFRLCSRDLGTWSCSSAREASSICCSPVLPDASSPFSCRETRARGESALPAKRTLRPKRGGGGRLNAYL